MRAKVLFIGCLCLFMAACSQEACTEFSHRYTYHRFRLLDSGHIEFKVSSQNITNVEAFLRVNSQEEPMVQEDEKTWIATAPAPEEGKMMVQFRLLYDGWFGSRVETFSLRYLVWVDENSEVTWEFPDER